MPTDAVALTALGPRLRPTVLFEQLSGMPAHHAPLRAHTAARELQVKITEFPATLTPDLAAGLTWATVTFLHRHGVTDEPLTWQRSWSLLDGLDLPGPDPEEIDLAGLHQLVPGRGTVRRGTRCYRIAVLGATV